MQRSNRLRLTEVNQHLVCFLCGGYFIDATTIVECLHSFCRSCLIKYLESNSFCPICEVQIHKAKPFLNIKPDKALQDIVYKLVPGLFHSEMRRRREFYVKHPQYLHETTPEGRGVGVERLIYSPDDSISLSLEYLDGEDDFGCTSASSKTSDSSGGQVSQPKRYLQCPALVTVAHLKKFLRIKYELASEHTVEVIHRRESLADDYTLMDIAYIHTWKRNGPMRFFYRIYNTEKDVSSTTEGVVHPKPVELIPQPRKTSQPTSTVTRPSEPASTHVEGNPEKILPKPDTRQPSPKPLDTRLPIKTTPVTIVPTNQVNTVVTNSTQSVTKSSPSLPKGTQPHPKSVQILPKSSQQPIKGIQLSTKPVQSSSKSIQLPPKIIQSGPKNIQPSPKVIHQLPKSTQPSSKTTQSSTRNTQPPIISITVTSAQVTTVTTTVTSTLSLQTSSPAVCTQQFPKVGAKSSTSVNLPLSKTSTTAKSVSQSVPSNLPQVSIQLVTATAGKSSMNSPATVARAPTQRQYSLTTVSKASSSRPIATEQIRTTANEVSEVSSTVIPSKEQSIETTTKDSIQTTPTTVTKLSTHSVPRQAAQSIHNESAQSLSASPSSELVKLNEQTTVEGKSNKTMPISPSTASTENPVCEAKSMEIKASEDYKTETVESTTPKIINTTPSNENKKVANIPVVPNGPTNLNATKPLLAKAIQQRSQMMMARKTTQLVKDSTDSTNTKVNSVSVKNQLQTNKEATKNSRVNQKAVDKQGTSENPIALRKDRIQLKSGINEAVKKDSDNSALNTNEMQTVNTTNNIQTNNNNINKVPQQNQQIIRNNQQILKKNDEIMRCVNSIKRPIQIFQRKPPELTKPYTSQLKTQDDKLNVKKRRVTTVMPVKRPPPSSVEVSRQDDMQPVAKKPRPGVENNRKLNHIDQKPLQVKLKSVPNSVATQNLQNISIKSDASGETPTNVLKTNNSHFQVSSLIATTEHNKSTDVKNQESDKNNVTNDKLQSSVPVQRTALHTQAIVRPKQCNTPAIIKTESSVPKSDITPPQARGSSSHVQTSQCAPLPVPVVAHSNANSRLCSTPRPPAVKGKVNVDEGAGALDLSASPRRAHPSTILSIAQTLALRQQQKCPSPAPPPLSPLSSLSPFPVMSSVPVRSPPPQLRIPMPPHHRPAHSQQPQQRPSSLSSSSPSPPADILPGTSRMRPPQQQPDMYASHLLPPAALMFRHQLELQRMWGAGKHNTPAGMEWFNDTNSVKRFEHFMKTLQHQQQSGRSTPFYPFNNNTAAATNSHRK